MSIHALSRVIGNVERFGIYYEYVTRYVPIKCKNTGKDIVIPVKQKTGPFYRHEFIWTGHFWCPRQRMDRWAGTPRLDRANELYKDKPEYFIDKAMKGEQEIFMQISNVPVII